MSPLLRLKLFVFLGAFLLFAMEPLTGKLLLPAYGGSFFVWATCLMVFQGGMFLGYLTCHLLGGRIGGWHLVLLVLPLLALPLAVTSSPDPAAPIGSLLRDLVLGVGLPFWALATTGVVAQQWLAGSGLAERSDPYQLYGASNLGSLLALLAYPLVFEPLIGLTAQRTVWSASYLVYLALAVWAWRGIRADWRPLGQVTPHGGEGSEDVGAERTPRGRVLYWFLLSMIPSAFLLAVTNVISTDVGSLPLVWVLPLALYLLSFVFVFGRRSWTPHVVRRFWPEISAVGVTFYAIVHHTMTLWWAACLVHLAVLLFVCWACHAELHRTRPAPVRLSGFYLLVSLGGWAGGLFVSVLAPHVFDRMPEYPLILGLLVLTFLVGRRDAFRAWFQEERPFLIGGSVLLFVIAGGRIALEPVIRPQRPVLAYHRSVYGQYRVSNPAPSDKVPLRRFYHGTTEHGREALGEYKGGPIGYYHPDSPMGEVIQAAPRPRRVGVIGLGAGVIASYFEAGEELDYFELDPLVERLARRYFTYLSAGKARLRVVPGDARVSLQREPDGRYDLLLVDAFSSDAIPIHLLTREALELYERKLKPRGRLLFHISNRYYELAPALAATGALVPGLHGLHKLRTVGGLLETPTEVYMFLRSETQRAAFLEGRQGWLRDERLVRSAAWTDDHSNPLAVLRLIWY